jgi:hypothetical protein
VHLFSLYQLTSLHQLLFTLKISFTFFYKRSYLNVEVCCTKTSPSVSIPWTTVFNVSGNLTNTFSVLCQLGATYVPVTKWPTCNINNCLVIPVSIGFTALTKAPVPVGSPVTYNCSAAGNLLMFFNLI